MVRVTASSTFKCSAIHVLEFNETTKHVPITGNRFAFTFSDVRSRPETYQSSTITQWTYSRIPYK
jgi:hypothetical protein